MNLIDLKLKFAKISNTAFVFLKKNKPIFINRIKKIKSTIPISKNSISEKKLLVTGILAAIFFLWILSYPFISLDVDKKNAFLEVKKGDNLTQVANKLVKKNILSNIFRFKLLAKLSNRSESIKSGHYYLYYDISPNELLTLLENGEGVLYPITFIEGTTLQENLAKLKNNKLLTNVDSYNSINKLKKQKLQTSNFFGIPWY